MFDLIIIGGGPIGLACAIEARKKNLRYLILEKGALVNSLYHYPLYMTFFSTAERLEIGDAPFTCLAPKPGRPEAIEYYRKVTGSFKLNINLYEAVADVQPHEGGFRVTSSRAVYQAAKVIVATGFYDIPMLMDIPGEDLPQVRHYYKEPHEYAFQKVLVVGASNSSVDAALETWRKGADVTLVARGPGIGPRVKYWVKPDIENRIEEGSIKAHFNTSLTAIRPGAVDLLTPDGPLTLENDFVLALTGYRPNFEWLQQCGIALSDDGLCKPVYNPATMETNIPGLYLAGVVCGGLETHKWFIENSRIHGNLIIDHITRTP
ncbi:YpdA family putative bacillithiol disulfide reductase [Taibaiella chishuiensis]|uniref:Thioredoxin reductase (NADPH) n=1 Tax=Taibaiella chishuiensis TaxID=1434707 RepID=A0A2P8CXY1_9BACT|nr:YpdA family putative bacillithiol disulfide reductase [Taibaiella chishuiensis]PSK89829.1 thioredoxin reductase (NADPH) [Taibaiella chishuiensis]